MCCSESFIHPVDDPHTLLGALLRLPCLLLFLPAPSSPRLPCPSARRPLLPEAPPASSAPRTPRALPSNPYSRISRSDFSYLPLAHFSSAPACWPRLRQDLAHLRAPLFLSPLFLRLLPSCPCPSFSLPPFLSSPSIRVLPFPSTCRIHIVRRHLSLLKVSLHAGGKVHQQHGLEYQLSMISLEFVRRLVERDKVRKPGQHVGF
ncbi:hypothetical protein B0H17DRAFT_249659 [Mycena rosella]|uniref:Uncharacterized protein n=1 Tax=Mycena rosella TaxID=1033263 RepID=A0AAD7H1E7_MYCRO|nr:hypothetical protein B0H17DRAFT_249659 [Mycena rosella]